MISKLAVTHKKIVISGATGVLGESMTRFLAAQGAQVIVLGRTQSKVDTLVAAINDAGHKASGILADVTRKEDLQQAKNNAPWSTGLLCLAAGVEAGLSVRVLLPRAGSYTII